jgi:DeoR family suf operon transcriptional repressor
MPNPRLFATTAGRILLRLCRGRLTVNELARGLSLTKNAIRAQLDRLLRAKLVAQTGSRKGIRRPHAEYELTAKAQRLFPTAYEPVLGHLTEVLAERLPAETAAEVLREAGRRAIIDHLQDLPAGDARQRVEELAKRLNANVGGAVLLAQHGDRLVLSSCSCPLATITAAHENICDSVADLLGELLGAEVRQKCVPGQLRQCCFEIELDPGRSATRRESSD